MCHFRGLRNVIVPVSVVVKFYAITIRCFPLKLEETGILQVLGLWRGVIESFKGAFSVLYQMVGVGLQCLKMTSESF